MIAGLLLYLTLPVAMAGIVYVLRRWASLSALLAVGTALILGGAAFVLPLDQQVRSFSFLGRDYQIAMGKPVTFLGRELIVEQADQMAMAFLFLTAAGLFVLAWRVAPRSLISPVGLGVLSLLSGALLIRPLIYAALFVEIAAAFSVIALQAEDQPPTRGGLRYLTFTILALPGLLVTHWLMEQYALTPDRTGLLSATVVLLTISFALLLGSVPFHIWVPAISGGTGSVPLAGIFILTIGNGAIWFLLLDFLETYSWLSSYPSFAPLVSNVGLVMIVVGGLLAPGQRRLGRVIGYGALIDSGAALIALGMNNRLGVSLVLLSLLMRPFGLILMATGLSGLQAHSGGDDSFEELRGLGWEAPWSTAALTFGGLSVAGLPVSAGFVWRWAFYRSLAPSSPGLVVLLLLSGVGVMVGVWHGLSALLAPPQPSEDEGRSQAAPEGWLTAAIVAVAILGCVGVGLFPQFLAPLASRLAGTYTFGEGRLEIR